MNMTAAMEARTNKPLTACTDQEIYLALLDIVREQSAARVRPVTGRKLYYISAEFLIGKLLSNNLINLGLYNDTRAALAAAGKNLSDIEEVEPEPSLGNGGLGRLAACFLDSLATLNLPGDGVGLRYHFGLFHQSFKDGVQNELPDPWLTAHSWAEKTDTVYPVELAGKTYNARLYKLAVTGYEGRTNTLNLFDLDTIDESIVHDGITFDKTDIDKNLTLFLYPDDSDEAGRRLRVYQQYLMVSAGAQLILAECAARGCDYHDLADYAAIQINDTHPSMVIPELIRLLGEKGIDFDEAVEIVTKTCAYTNHTILAEALEKWPRAYLDAVVPQLMPIIEKLDTLARTRTTDESLAIIDGDDRVHMAHMDIHFTHSTNGVAYLHTEILKNSELHGFYQLYPEKFNNKTNGITFRRWLLECDPALTAEIDTIDAAALQPGEEKTLQERKNVITHAQSILAGITAAHLALAGDEDGEQAGAADLLGGAVDGLQNSARLDESLTAMSERLNDLYYSARELATDLADRLDAYGFDAGELDQIETRLDAIYRIKQKFGMEVDELLARREAAAAELETFQSSGQKIAELKAQMQTLYAAAKEAAEKLTQSRLKGFAAMNKEMKAALEFLNMPGIRFALKHTRGPLSSHGQDTVEFLISTNPGEEPKPLAKIASGGELSRIMLAFKSALADRDALPTVIYDEIDTGVSGLAAGRIGQLLHQTARGHQVLCITHTPQVAAFADNQLLIQKNVRKDRTFTEIHTLDMDGRVEVLARMISGDKVSELSLASARELIEKSK
mgnify:CR=1 FL=1